MTTNYDEDDLGPAFELFCRIKGRAPHELIEWILSDEGQAAIAKDSERRRKEACAAHADWEASEDAWAREAHGLAQEQIDQNRAEATAKLKAEGYEFCPDCGGLHGDYAFRQTKRHYIREDDGSLTPLKHPANVYINPNASPGIRKLFDGVFPPEDSDAADR
jgi:hypothetical protein